MRLTVEVPMTVTMADGTTHQVGKMGAAELIAFERQFGVPAGRLNEDQRLEYFVFLAYVSLRRQKLVNGSFDEFLEGLEDVAVGTEDPQGEGPGKAPASGPEALTG